MKLYEVYGVFLVPDEGAGEGDMQVCMIGPGYTSWGSFWYAGTSTSDNIADDDCMIYNPLIIRRTYSLLEEDKYLHAAFRGIWFARMFV